MFAALPDVENVVDGLIENHSYNDALANILVGVHNHRNLPNSLGKFLYYEQLDNRLQTLAGCLSQQFNNLPQSPLSQNTLIIASELYSVGGHSRVVADIARFVPLTTIVVTDMLWQIRKAPDMMDWQFDAFPSSSVIVLNQLSLWGKCAALFELTLRLQPKNILYFNHHEDPIPFVGTLEHKGSHKTLIHHCDHNPSLGNTLKNVDHVDFTEEMAVECSSNLRRNCSVLPLYVPDCGQKLFKARNGTKVSAVTSGSGNKFSRGGSLSLSNIVKTVLDSIDGDFFHIGHIDSDWISEIRTHLSEQGIDPKRYISMGLVPSLWKALFEIDAHVYIASAPIGGGRAAIEAQGCGYPVVYFHDRAQRTALGAVSLYSDHGMGWSDLEQLRRLLSKIDLEKLVEKSECARRFYEARYSEGQFRTAIKAFVR
jgi:hypothetical protein